MVLKFRRMETDQPQRKFTSVCGNVSYNHICETCCHELLNSADSNSFYFLNCHCITQTYVVCAEWQTHLWELGFCYILFLSHWTHLMWNHYLADICGTQCETVLATFFPTNVFIQDAVMSAMNIDSNKPKCRLIKHLTSDWE